LISSIAARRTVAAATAAVALAFTGSASAADIVSDFSTDNEGWQETQDGQTFTAAHRASGGYLLWNDADSEFTGDQPTPKIGGWRGGPEWTGDLADHMNGTLSWKMGPVPDSHCESQFPFGACIPMALTISGPAGTIAHPFDAPPVPGTVYTVPVSGAPQQDGFYYPGSDAHASDAYIADVLADVTSVDIQADWAYVSLESTTLDDVTLSGGSRPGITHANRVLTLAYSKARKRFEGKLSSPDGDYVPECWAGQAVSVYRKRKGPDRRIGSATTTVDGDYWVNSKRSPGTYYAKAKRSRGGEFLTCDPAKSPPKKLG
jgi:hypothetical protein